jgi:hypothetical protein
MKALVGGLVVGAVGLAAATSVAQTQGQSQAPGQYPSQPNQAPSQPYPAQPYPTQPYPTQQGYPGQQGGYNAGAEQTLATADRQDTGRGLEWVWLDAEMGYALVSPQVLSNKNLTDGTTLESKASGLSYGAALGVRVIALTLGARFRYGNFAPWDLWSLDLEAGFHIPLGHWEPFVELGAGYSRMAAYKLRSVVPSGLQASDLDIDGYNIRLGGGIDYYFTPRFSAGALVHGELLGLHRAAGSPAQPVNAIYGISGFGLGLGVDASVVLGLHF